MEARRFKVGKGRAVLWSVVGLMTLFMILPIAVLLPMIVGEAHSVALYVVTAVCAVLCWLNLAWLFRNFGLLLAGQLGYVMITTHRSGNKSYVFTVQYADKNGANHSPSIPVSNAVAQRHLTNGNRFTHHPSRGRPRRERIY